MTEKEKDQLRRDIKTGLSQVPTLIHPDPAKVLEMVELLLRNQHTILKGMDSLLEEGGR